MEVIDNEKQKSRIKREGTGACKAAYGKLRKHRRYLGKA